MDERMGETSRTLLGHSGPVYRVTFDPFRSLLLSCSEDGTGKFDRLSYNAYLIWTIFNFFNCYSPAVVTSRLEVYSLLPWTYFPCMGCTVFAAWLLFRYCVSWKNGTPLGYWSLLPSANLQRSSVERRCKLFCNLKPFLYVCMYFTKLRYLRCIYKANKTMYNVLFL